jgi:hypothetical protein
MHDTGATTLLKAGLKAAEDGRTSLDEVLRVALFE